MLITSLIFIEKYWSYISKTLLWFKESNWRRIFAVSLNQFSQLLRMMKIEIFLTLILYISLKNENIIPTNMCYDKVNVFTQKLQEIGITISNKMWKSLNPHNFLIIYCNIVMLQLKIIVSIQGVQLKKNIWNST